MKKFNLSFYFLLCFLTIIPLAQVNAVVLSDMTTDEKIDVLAKSESFAKPDNVYNYGSEVGVVKYCPEVKGSRYDSLVENSKNWLKIASLEFPGNLSDGGFLNSRKYKKLLSIFNDGLKRGQKDSKKFRKARDYKYGLCKEFLYQGSDLYGPSSRLVRLIKEN